MKQIALFTLLAFVLTVVWIGCSVNKAAEQKGPPPIQVSAFTVEQGMAAYFDDYPATVTALSQVEIRPQVSGYITGIYFEDGQHVTKGMKLYAIDQQQYQAAYDQAIANLNVAKANLARAQQDADRYSDLAKSDAVARQTLEHALADLQSAKMQVEAVDANVKRVQTDLRYSIIEAPFDGTIGISLVKLGSAVSTGQTLLNTISTDNPMAVDCAVDEKQIARFARLLNGKSEEKDSTFSIVLPDQSMYAQHGHLIVLDRAVDPQTGTIRIRAVFPNPANILKAGLTCNLRVRANSVAASILIPYRAVTEQMGEYFVFAISNNKVSQRRISLGMTIKDMVVVKDGLQPGEQIVIDGIQRLRDNALVAVAPSAPTQTSTGTQGI